MVDPRLNCKSCRQCSLQNEHRCPSFGFLGYSGFGGGFSEVCPVEEHMLYKLPDNVDLSVAALVEPLVVAYHAVKLTGWDDLSEKSALIVGGGPVGYAVALALRAKGCKKIVLSEPTRKRLEQTGKVVEVVVDPTQEDVGEKCREVTDGAGVDVGFDCAGVQRGLDAALDAIAYGGTWVNVSLWENDFTVPFWKFFIKEIKMIGSFCYNMIDFAETMDLLAQGKFGDFPKMITGRISLEDVAEKGFRQLIENKDDHVKILVTAKKDLLI